jgi:hypothetical protein
MENLKDLIIEMALNILNEQSDYEKDQEHHHILKAQEHETKSSIHSVRARRLADAKKTKTPEYKMHMELAAAHEKAMRPHISSHVGYSQRRVAERNGFKKRSEDPDNKFRDENKRTFDRLTAEHKKHIKNAKEASDHADALSKSHGQDYSAYEHSFKKIRD